MSTLDDYYATIAKRVTKIMYENKDLFPIVDDIFCAVEKYKIPESDIEFYARGTIETRIGLMYIIRNKVNAVNDLRFLVNATENVELEEIYDIIEKGLIKSILSEYMSLFPDKNQVAKFKNIV